MSWNECTIRGVNYAFDHLKPFTMVVGGLRVRVKFGAHVFCKEPEPSDHQDFRFMDGGTQRTFCPVRYGLSLTLGPALIAASNGYVYEGRKGKYIFKQTLPAPQGVYLLAFEMWRCKAPHYDVTMQLNSAHTRPYVAKSRFSRFDNVISAIANGDAIPWIKK